MEIVRGLKKASVMTVAGINIATVALMILTGYSDLFNPEVYPVGATLGLAFPILLMLNLALLVFWLLAKWRMAWIPIAGYALCLPAIRVYMPLNPQTEAPQGALKVLSYNVFNFGGTPQIDSTVMPIVDFINNSGADIVCLQEANGVTNTDKIDSLLAHVYQYRDTAWHSNSSSDRLMLLSKFPILGKERIPYKSTYNISVAWTVDINGQKVRVINNHFESNRITDEEKKKFKEMLKGKLGPDSSSTESRSLLRLLARAAKMRAPQVNAVARYIKRHKGESIILCGDFNDCPISYTHRQLASLLNDCYTSTGCGPGVSYHKGAMYVRIDNIMCSQDFQPYGAEVYNKIDASDHYPIFCWLKKTLKTKK